MTVGQLAGPASPPLPGQRRASADKSGTSVEYRRLGETAQPLLQRIFSSDPPEATGPLYITKFKWSCKGRHSLTREELEKGSKHYAHTHLAYTDLYNQLDAALEGYTSSTPRLDFRLVKRADAALSRLLVLRNDLSRATHLFEQVLTDLEGAESAGTLVSWVPENYLRVGKWEEFLRSLKGYTTPEGALGSALAAADRCKRSRRGSVDAENDCAELLKAFAKRQRRRGSADSFPRVREGCTGNCCLHRDGAEPPAYSV